jgi:twitching motility two-component system response regulator PilG
MTRYVGNLFSRVYASPSAGSGELLLTLPRNSSSFTFLVIELSFKPRGIVEKTDSNHCGIKSHEQESLTTACVNFSVYVGTLRLGVCRVAEAVLSDSRPGNSLQIEIFELDEEIRVHDDIKLSYLGLTVNEVRVLKSIFTLAPQLSENFSLTSPAESEAVDVFLVDADDPQAVARWKKIKLQNELAMSLMLSSQGESAEGDVTLQRPIRVQKLIAALNDIIEDKTQTSNAGSAGQVAEPEVCVLIVDDSYPVRKYMEHKLAELIQEPLKMSFAASGEEAIAKVNKRNYDIIFLDVMMEGVDGYKVCKTIKAARKAYIVMLTSKKSPFDKVRGTMSGCDAYVTKPPSDESLLNEVRKCIQNRDRMQALGHG